MLRDMFRKRNSFLLRLVIAICVLFVLGNPPFAQEIVVRISRVAGPVEVRKAGAPKWARAESGSVIRTGDSLRTLKGGKAQLVFPQNIIVLIKENSLLNLKEVRADGAGRVKTLVGGFLFDLKKALSPGSSFEVETPSALAVVRGTKFGDDVGLDGTTVFTGYEDTVEIIAQNVSRFLEPGFEITVPVGEPPGEPQPTERTWTEEFFTAEDVELPTGEEYLSQLSQLETQYGELANTVSGFYEEFRRYELEGDVPRMSSIFYNIQPFKETFERLNSQYESLKATLSSDPNYGLFLAPAGIEAETEALGYRDEWGSRIHELVLVIGAHISSIQSSLDYIYEQMDEYVSSLEDVLDVQRGTIESREPERDIRYGTLDTDNDGVPDIVESALGIEPGSEQEVIELISPDDGASFSYPDDSSIFFEFSVADATYFTSFELVLTAGGITAVKPFSGFTMELPVTELATGSPSFAELLQVGAEVEFSWFVRGNFDYEVFASSQGSSSQASQLRNASAITIRSETRIFTLRYGAAQIVDLSLSPVGPATAHIGDVVTLRLNLSEVSGLAKWAIAVRFDPALVEFDTGRKTGLTSGFTVFFGESELGIVTVSGEVSRGSPPISGSGPFAELVFIARNNGIASFSFGLVELTGSAGESISTGSLDGTEVEILPEA